MNKHRKFFNISTSDNENEVDIYIYGPIGLGKWDEDSTDALDFIKEFKELEKKFNIINIRINSAGGIISEGLPIYNVIKNSKKETRSYIDGIAYSMAAIIALASDKIYAAKNSLILLHNASGIEWGNANDFRDMAGYLDKHDTALVTSIMDKTGLTEKEVRNKWFDYKDHIMNADEAMSEKLIDEIVEKQIDLPKNIKSMKMNEVMDYLNSLDTNDKEEKFINKIVNQVKNLIFNKQTVKTEITMEQLKQLIDAVGLKSDASFEDLLAEVTSFKQKLSDAITAKTNAENAKDTAVNEKASLEQATLKVSNSLDELGASVKEATTTEAKVEAVRTLLAAKPGASATEAAGKDTNLKVSGVDQEAIDNLPHNREYDANQLK